MLETRAKAAAGLLRPSAGADKAIARADSERVGSRRLLHPIGIVSSATARQQSTSSAATRTRTCFSAAAIV
jgi:hypothetical protein